MDDNKEVLHDRERFLSSIKNAQEKGILPTKPFTVDIEKSEPLPETKTPDHLPITNNPETRTHEQAMETFHRAIEESKRAEEPPVYKPVEIPLTDPMKLVENRPLSSFTRSVPTKSPIIEVKEEKKKGFMEKLLNFFGLGKSEEVIPVSQSVPAEENEDQIRIRKMAEGRRGIYSGNNISPIGRNSGLPIGGVRLTDTPESDRRPITPPVPPKGSTG